MKNEKPEKLAICESMTEAEFETIAKNPRFLEFMQRQQAVHEDAPDHGVKGKLVALREEHSEVQREKSLRWVLKTFANMIRVKEQILMVYFAVIESTERTRAEGLTNAADKWNMIVSMPAETMSLLHIDIILDEDRTDDEKIRAMIKHAKDERDSSAVYDQSWRWIDTPGLSLETQMVR